MFLSRLTPSVRDSCALSFYSNPPLSQGLSADSHNLHTTVGTEAFLKHSGPVNNRPLLPLRGGGGADNLVRRW